MTGPKRGAGLVFDRAASSRSFAGSMRRKKSLLEPKARLAQATFDCSACSRVGRLRPGPGNSAPLSPMALAKRSLAMGEAISALTDEEPADWPKMVMLAGSPPKAAMLRRTHAMAAAWSLRPYLPEAWLGDSAVSSGWAKKPKMPRR